ncbi:MAG: hypothetical protein IJ637_06260 [Prevotella sp.]|nr:hypothetical protein [Prevotella sp.]
MKNIKNIFTLAVVALTGLSLAGCSEDNLNTDPYSQSGVNIVGFGPSPILRTHEIHITGTSMNSVTSVAFPGEGAVVEKADFNSVDNQNIYVNVPDASVPGHIRLMVGNDTVATSVSLLTFEEPITVSSVEPTTALNAGDEIVIKGDYVYNIAQVVFTCGVTGAPVDAENFTYVSRREIHVPVPLAAQSGTITMNDGADWELTWETPLQVLAPTYTGLSSTTGEFGSQIQITGTNLHTVETVMFPGGVTADFTVSADHNSLTVTVPAECKSGAITLVYYSGDSQATDEFNVPTLKITNVSKTKDLKVGDQIVVTGEYFDRIVSVTLPGMGVVGDSVYTISGNTMTITVHEQMTDGTVEFKQNSYITESFKVMMYSEAPEITIWAGSTTIGNWDGSMGDLSWGKYDWSTVQPGQVLSIYLTPDMSEGWSQIRVGNGNWAALPGTEENISLSAEDTKVTVALTADMINELVNNGGLVLCGAFFTVTKVTLSILETVLWKGELGPTNWNGDLKIDMTDEIKAELQPGRKMGIEFRCDEGGGQVEICGTWWTSLEGPKNVYTPLTDEGRAIMNFDASVTSFEWTLVQGDIDILTNQGGILFVGNGGLTITKWYVK